MKKVLAILMALVMVLSFAACSKDPVDDEPGTEAETVADEAVSEEASEDAVTGDTVAKTLAAEFKALAATETDALAIAEKLAQSAAVSAIGPAAMELELEENYLSGFDNYEVTGFDKCIMVAPMMGTIPFVSYVFTLSEGTDADAFVKGLEDNANLRWNICTEAEEMAAVAEGNFVFFVMAPVSFDA